MSDIVTRLRNWRTVHLARLHLLMEEAADEMEMLAGYRDAAEADRAVAMTAAERLRLTGSELAAVQRAVSDESDRGMGYTADVLQSLLDRLSGDGDCPEPDNAATQDTVGSTLAQRITGLQPMLEYREQIAILRADNNRRADLEVGLREGVQKLQAEVRRLEAVIAALADQDATLSVVGGDVIVEMDATLTVDERAAVDRGINALSGVEDVSADACRRDDDAARTLRSLLERREAGYGDDEWV